MGDTRVTLQLFQSLYLKLPRLALPYFANLLFLSSHYLSMGNRHRSFFLPSSWHELSIHMSLSFQGRERACSRTMMQLLGENMFYLRWR